MNDDRIVKRVYNAEVSGDRARGRPRKRWKDGVSEAMERKGFSYEEGMRCVNDRAKWRKLYLGGRGVYAQD